MARMVPSPSVGLEKLIIGEWKRRLVLCHADRMRDFLTDSLEQAGGSALVLGARALSGQLAAAGSVTQLTPMALRPYERVLIGLASAVGYSPPPVAWRDQLSRVNGDFRRSVHDLGILILIETMVIGALHLQ